MLKLKGQGCADRKKKNRKKQYNHRDRDNQMPRPPKTYQYVCRQLEEPNELNASSSRHTSIKLLISRKAVEPKTPSQEQYLEEENEVLSKNTRRIRRKKKRKIKMAASAKRFKVQPSNMAKKDSGPEGTCTPQPAQSAKRSPPFIRLKRVELSGLSSVDCLNTALVNLENEANPRPLRPTQDATELSQKNGESAEFSAPNTIKKTHRISTVPAPGGSCNEVTMQNIMSIKIIPGVESRQPVNASPRILRSSLVKKSCIEEGRPIILKNIISINIGVVEDSRSREEENSPKSNISEEIVESVIIVSDDEESDKNNDSNNRQRPTDVVLISSDEESEMLSRSNHNETAEDVILISSDDEL